MLPWVLPNTDRQSADALVRCLQKQGITFQLQSGVTGMDMANDSMVAVRIQEGESSSEITCDKILVAVGRKPLTENLGLAEVGVDLDEKGRVIVDENYQTGVRGIYAIGDLIAGPLLAHKAMEEGVVCVERIAGQASGWNMSLFRGYLHLAGAGLGR
jgi:dihydrolipoamide dehydrogenase